MRRPIELEVKACQTPRDRVWRAIRMLATGFTVRSVQDACAPMVSYAVVHDYLNDLERAGYVRTIDGGRRTAGTQRFVARKMELMRDQLETPRVHHGREGRQGMGSLALWRAMKVLTTGFCARDLAAAASFGEFTVTQQMAELYARRLCAAGFLTPEAPPRPGRPTYWRLVKYTGPRAPAMKRDGRVFDRNTGEVIESTLSAQRDVPCQ